MSGDLALELATMWRCSQVNNAGQGETAAAKTPSLTCLTYHLHLREPPTPVFWKTARSIWPSPARVTSSKPSLATAFHMLLVLLEVLENAERRSWSVTTSGCAATVGSQGPWVVNVASMGKCNLQMQLFVLSRCTCARSPPIYGGPSVIANCMKPISKGMDFPAPGSAAPGSL
ncbi:unnamed protein product [Polarella glacialis]|uniref:Uncharacterized protein n=1 Tax=Polarella glacialis TaxID=89957 RepID=A0A813DMY3_POLGL|nr:unnamed protein product [Polarella glacialis]